MASGDGLVCLRVQPNTVSEEHEYGEEIDDDE
jgi:hypothetical protein